MFSCPPFSLVSERDGYIRKNQRLELKVRKLKLKLNGLSLEHAREQESIQEVSQQYKGLQTDVQEVMKSAGFDLHKLKEGAVRLFRAHVQTQAHREEASLADLHHDYLLQRLSLEKTVEGLRAKLDKAAKVHQKDHQRITKENVELISEINELRREIKIMRQMQKQKVTDSLTAEFFLLPSSSSHPLSVFVIGFLSS